ncbi:MAG: HAMP domain-containing sensor histidine kinase [Vicinamibacterales bacterium]
MRAGTRVALLVSSISALVVALGLALAAKATLARNRLADMRSDFTAAVTHDLKTPIATIRAISESFFIRADVDQATRRETTAASCRTRRGVSRGRSTTCWRTRGSPTSPISTRSGRCRRRISIRRTFEEFRFQMELQGFTATIDVPDDLPRIHGDATALGLALANIFDNALRYSEERKVLTVRAQTHASAVAIEVADAGVGIPRDEIAHVTQKFYRGSTTTSGGGLGLAIALRVVNDHRGQLSISSEVGQGTVVRIVIPASREE